MNIPNWYELALLAIAAWRVFQLIALDDLLDRPRRYVTRLGKKWENEGDPVPDNYRLSLADFITCPYCAGFWIATVWYMLWWWQGDPVLAVASIFALSAGVVGLHKILSSE